MNDDASTPGPVGSPVDRGVGRLAPKRAMQCKDVPDAPVLRFLAQRPGVWHNWYFGNDKDVRQAMPPGLPDKLVLGKMRMLMRRGLVSGCDCGCRGDFEITPKGQAWLAAYREPPNVGGEVRLAAHQPSHTTTATPQGVASTDQLGGRVRSEKD